MLVCVTHRVFAQHQLLEPATFHIETMDTTLQKLDVRSGMEYEAIGHIEGFEQVNLYDPHFKEKINTMFDPSIPILVTCFSGHRSSDAVKILLDMGFKDVRELKGGIIAWIGAGYPLE